MKKFTIFIIILAVITGILGFYYYQKNIYSKEALRLEILGSEQADVLQEIEYIVKYKNNGETRLDDPQLIFEYPEHSIPSEDTSLRITKSSDELGQAIYPGQEQTFHFKCRLFGKQGESKKAQATLSYQPKNLKARYESITTFTTIIEKVPFTFNFDLPSKIESGKELEFNINYFSNIEYPLSNLRVSVEYPTGFEFIGSTPQSLEKIEWDIGLLNRAEGGRIEISGKLLGGVGAEEIFKAKIGSWQDGEFVLLKEITKGITIIQPSLYISQQINGNPEYAASPGDLLHYQVFFKNIGEDLLSNLFLIAKLEGEAFDFDTLRAPQGEFESGDNSIIFDWKRIAKLQFLDAGKQGEIEFWIELKKEWPIFSAEDKNPVITSKIYLSQAEEEFINKVNSKLVISQKVYFQDEVFGNTGPMPPKVGKDTTYTVMWQAKNYYNDVNDVRVKAVLPENVDLTGKIFPEDESSNFALDSESREIVWEVKELKMSQGILGTPCPNISFQIKFNPSESQKGKTLEIIQGIKIIGLDNWTGDEIEATALNINTTLPDDETITKEMGIVQ